MSNKITKLRKIIHVDMDAFYASVEQRDNPSLQGKPVAVGYEGKYGVVTTASYEARTFGVHSAMSMVAARRLCPQIIVVPPRFDAYREVSTRIHEVFANYTDLIEPVSLDEAYLDVTSNKKHDPSAWTVAQNIRDDIYKATHLTASAGVSYNKFLAKSASDVMKPNGQYLIRPEDTEAFISALPIGKFHGIGPKTTEVMHAVGIENGKALRLWPEEALRSMFGKNGAWYYRIARGEDDREVESDRDRKSISAETTFRDDIHDVLRATDELYPLVTQAWNMAIKRDLYGKTITLKIKWDDFTQTTRSRTIERRLSEKDDFVDIGQDLLKAIFPITKGIRLLGIGMSNFKDNELPESNQLPLDLTL